VSVYGIRHIMYIHDARESVYKDIAKVVPLNATKTLGGRGDSSYSFSTSALDGGEWSVSRPGRVLTLGKGPSLPTVQEAGWAPEPVWTTGYRKNPFASAGGSNLDRPVVQPVARHYTD
jgi:hypothetical protein